MRILVFGGTLFLGRHVVEAALTRGHEVTLFNRGVTSPDLFPDVEKLKGDRSKDLTPLKNRQWDAVIDPSGYIAHHVRASVELLANSVGHYSLVSTNGVYTDVGDEPVDENWKVATPVDESINHYTGKSFNIRNETTGGFAFDNVIGHKVLCEQIVQEKLSGRALVYRPGLIVGPHDRTDRFTYWIRRISQGGKILVPKNPKRPQQIIDVRDLAEWNVRMAESRQTGVYNTEGPDYKLTMKQILDECQTITNSEAELVWVEQKFLDEQGETSYDGMPPWPKDPLGLAKMNCEKAIKKGLTFRPLADTIMESLKWDSKRDLDDPLPIPLPVKAGPSLQREEELLKAWSKRQV